MPIAPEQVQAPARDAMLFKSSPTRTFVALFVLLMLSFAAVSPIAAALGDGGSGRRWWVTALQAAVVAALAAGAYAYSTRGSLTTWVRISSGGLELAAQDSDPILLAWSDIKHVTVRREGFKNLLEVTPVDLDVVHPVQGEEAGPPALADRPEGQSFTADLSEVWPSPRRLRRELAKYLPADPVGPIGP